MLSVKLIYAVGLILVLGIAYLLIKPHLNPVAPKQPAVKSSQGKERVKYPEDYLIVMLGDSMTETLGNSTELKQYLVGYYPNKTFEVLNYGYGATNILSAMDRITRQTEHGRKFRPIDTIDYQLILVESFGENPLSQYPLDQGLKIQTQELDKIVATLKQTNPKGKIVFVATISPNKVIFAQNQVDLTPEKRAQWVAERIAYMKNHIKYAQDHGIPLINIFEKSLLENGDGNPDYISTDDYIHPSPTGIIFISHQIADFIFKNKIL